MCWFNLLSHLLLILILVQSGLSVVTTCYNETSFWTGSTNGVKSECNPPATYCYKILGTSMSDTKNPRGCAYTYLQKACANFMEPNKSEFCLYVDDANHEIQGKLCCCSGNNCNHSSPNNANLLLLSLFAILIFIVFNFSG